MSGRFLGILDRSTSVVLYRRLQRLATLLTLLFLSTLATTVPARGQMIGQAYRLNDKEVDRMIKQIEKQSDRFRSSIDSALDKSRFNGSSREDDINAFVKEFYQETKRLHDRFDSHKSTAPDVESVLQRAARIDGFMRRYPLTPRAQDDWSTLRSYLDQLAEAYNVGWQWNGNTTAAGYPVSGTVVSNVPYRVTDREVDQILKQIEKQSNKFRSALDSALDKSRFDGTRQEDNINEFVKNYYSETKRLRDRFEEHKSTAADVQSVLDRASIIDEFMSRNRLRKKDAANEWAKLRVNLNELANVYGVNWRWR